MISHREWSLDYTPCSSGKFVFVGDDQKYNIQGVRVILIILNNGEDKMIKKIVALDLIWYIQG